jgi:hypothetical protein
MSEILKAIAIIMGEVGSVQKAGTNDFHRYKYATAADILHKLQPLMAKAGLIVFQTEREREFIEGGTVLSVTYEFTLAHKSGEVWPTPIVRTGMSAARNTKGGFDDKALNKCHTSAHKYFHLTLFEIPTGDYDDADGEEDRAPPPRGTARQQEAPSRREPAPPAKPAEPAKPTQAELDKCAEIERAFDDSETVEALEAARAEHGDALGTLPESLKSYLRKVYGLKKQALAAFADAAE